MFSIKWEEEHVDIADREEELADIAEPIADIDVKNH